VQKEGGLTVHIIELAADIDYFCSEWGASGYKVRALTHEPKRDLSVNMLASSDSEA